MKALTLWRPWTWAICHPSPKAKRVENRTWSPPRSLIGQDLAIHAGRRYDGADACRFIARILGELPPVQAHCREGIVAVARLAGLRFPPSNDPWLVGPVGWLLDNVRVLPRPIACKGAQGLWTLPPDVEAEVRRRLATGGRP